MPANLSRGFVFPEQISSSDTIIEEAYRYRDGNSEVIGWYFDVTLRQPFDYSKYPLDRHNTWIRMWHKNFNRNVVLIPDLDAYDSTLIEDTFGIDSHIVPGGWLINETFFQYRNEDYDTNFGIDHYLGQEDFPELYFNIIVQRKFLNAFVVNLVPLIIVAWLLFSALLTTTSEKEQAEKFGFNTSQVLGTAAALFFVVMLAHIQLREQFVGAGIVYLEHFYFIIYIAIFLVSLHVYLFSAGRRRRWLGFIHDDDNFMAKIAFWPFILGVLAVITLGYF